QRNRARHSACLGEGRVSIGRLRRSTIVVRPPEWLISLPDGIRTVQLPAGLTMLPVTEDVLGRLDPGAVGDERIPAKWELKQPTALARVISRTATSCTSSARRQEDPGTIEAIAWREGRMLYGPPGMCNQNGRIAGMSSASTPISSICTGRGEPADVAAAGPSPDRASALAIRWASCTSRPVTVPSAVVPSAPGWTAK